MRTRLFLAFLLVILLALASNLAFDRFIMKDFDEYVRGTKEDHLYWVLASVEGSFQDVKWDMNLLSEAVHWGMMLGFDVRVEDMAGRLLIDSHQVMEALPQSMQRRMEAVIHTHHGEGEFEPYPLYIGGEELGTLFVRPLSREGAIKVKEAIFKKRGRNFLILSFVLAGAGALVMAVFLSLFLSRPVKRLKAAADRVAKGDFSVRVEVSGRSARDEIEGLKERFNYMAEALEKEEALRKRLTANIAHELRTPLAVMKAQVEGMIDGVVEEKSTGLETVLGEIEGLTRLVEGIEDLAKAEAGFFAPGEYREVRLREFLQGIGTAMEPVFKEEGLSFSVADRGELVLTTDAEKLERVLRNILANALKYTEKGGATIDYGTRGDEVFVEVRDTGIGIPAEEIPQIFKRFYRGSRTPDAGIGIGLAIVQELIAIMGGRIEVESRVDEGTVFRLWLPARA